MTYPETLAAAAVKVAASLGVHATDPVVLADGANVIVHLSPAPVVAKVAASTPAVRPDNAAWLQRELDVVRFLAGRGVPVMTPSPEVPPVVHHGDGQVMSFWRYLSPVPGLAGEETIGSMLRDLHAELRDYPAQLRGNPAQLRGNPAQLPFLAPLGDIPAFLARPQTRLTVGQAAALAAAHARLTAQLDHGRGQSLHGDAGAGNLMATDAGWVWHDFEDTCTGPVAWDLAAPTASPRLDSPRILAAYGEPVDPAQLEVCQQLRRLHLTVWYNLYAERLPDLAPRAAELLTLWPVP
ncbi:MAG TPA: phosphotransferase [Streptosporangiaceae bacterium]